MGNVEVLMCYLALKGHKISAQGVEAQLRSPATLTDKCVGVLRLVATLIVPTTS